jgi:putative SOS response-associated peptidase YedK
MTINHERSPVLLTRAEEHEQWMSGSPDEAFSLLKPYDPAGMHIVREGFDKEDVA